MRLEDELLRLTSLEPSRDGLLAALRPLLTEDVLMLMAESDVGIDSEIRANLKALTQIRNTGKVPEPLDWNPAEVCNLSRWEKKSGDEALDTMCSFGSWILICAYVRPMSSQSGLTEDGDEHAIVSLCEHSIGFGSQMCVHAARFLYWAYLSFLNDPENRPESRPFYLLGLLVLSSATKDGLSFEDFNLIWNCLEKEEADIRRRVEKEPLFLSNDVGPLWVLGLAGYDLNNLQNRFRNVVAKVQAIQQTHGKQRQAEALGRILDAWASSAGQQE